MKLIATGKKEWQNRHETFTEAIQEMFIAGNEQDLDALESYNDATRAFQQQIKEAINTNTPLRMLGAGWSWTKICTVANGIIDDTKQLNTTFTISKKSVSPFYKGDSKKLLFAQCGTAIWELSNILGESKLSLKASGASNGQTIAGAMSTGAHGAAIDIGSVPEFVVGLHLIVGPNRHVWLERKSNPVIASTFVDKLEAEFIQDDELFNAALVSFGSFGIIHGVLIETEPLFLLECYMERRPYDDSLKNLMGSLDFSKAKLPNGTERPYHFSVIINPYDLAGGAYVSSFYKRPYQTNYKKPQPSQMGIGPGDDAPSFIGELNHLVPALVPTVVNKLIAGALQPFSKKFGTLAEIFNNTTLRGKLLSAAIGLPLDKVNKVTDLLLEINKSDGPFGGIFSYRYVKKSTATLGFTKFDSTCVLELDAAYSSDTLIFYTKVWNRLEAEKIPFTFHWGKMNELNPDRIKNMYGPNADAWIAARNKLLDKETMEVFSNEILLQWGLNRII